MKKFNQLKNSVFLHAGILSFVAFFMVVGFASAIVFTDAPLPTGTTATLNTVELLIGQIANFLIIISTVVAVIFIIWGGIAWMSAGSDETKQKAAKARIRNGVIGALIVLAFGVILNSLKEFLSDLVL